MAILPHPIPDLSQLLKMLTNTDTAQDDTTGGVLLDVVGAQDRITLTEAATMLTGGTPARYGAAVYGYAQYAPLPTTTSTLLLTWAMPRAGQVQQAGGYGSLAGGPIMLYLEMPDRVSSIMTEANT